MVVGVTGWRPGEREPGAEACGRGSHACTHLHRGRENALCGAVVAVYDVSRRETFDNLSQWLDEIEKFCPGGGKGTVKLLVGNKIDLVG